MDRLDSEATKNVLFIKREKKARENRLSIEAKTYPKWIEEVETNLVDDAFAHKEKEELEKFADHFYQTNLMSNDREA